MVDLFVYGTLMDEANVRTLTGRHLRRIEAVLPEFEKVVPEGGYPYIRPRPGSSVHGFLLLGIDERSLAALDAYEGELYVRQEVAVAVAGADARRPCSAYVGNLSAEKPRFGDDVA